MYTQQNNINFLWNLNYMRRKKWVPKKIKVDDDQTFLDYQDKT